MSFIDILDIIIDIFVIVSVIIGFYIFKKDHERSRRESSVELIAKWSNSLNEKTSLAKKYVEQLNRKQTAHLYAQEKVHFNMSNEDEKTLLENIRKLLNCSINNEKINNECSFLTEEESSELRWLIVNYLNILESILVAWQHHSADDSIIEQEFRYMFNLSKGNTMLKEFRMAAGNEECYPAIEMFYSHLEEERRKNLKRKPKI